MNEQNCSATTDYMLIIGGLKENLARLKNLAFWGSKTPAREFGRAQDIQSLQRVIDNLTEQMNAHREQCPECKKSNG